LCNQQLLHLVCTRGIHSGHHVDALDSGGADTEDVSSLISIEVLVTVVTVPRLRTTAGMVTAGGV
jgi:hypothetical protein